MHSLYLQLSIPRIAAVRALQPFWRGAVSSGISPLRHLNAPRPPLPGARWCRVRPLLSGICGSDLQLLKVQADLNVAPLALPSNHRIFMGHEVAGVVEESGERSSFRPGNRVALRVVDPNCWVKELAPHCRCCADGNYSICEKVCEQLDRVPSNAGAGWGNSFLAHETQLFAPAGDLSDEQVMLLEPAACALHGVLRRPPQPGHKVMVIGGGSIGIFTLMAARFLEPGCELTALVRRDFQARWAREAGADHVVMESEAADAIPGITGGKLYRGPAGGWMMLGGFDAVYDCAGTTASITSALRWTRSRGSVVVIGVNLRPRRLDYTPVWYQEVDLTGCIGHGTEVWQDRRISTFDLTSHMLRSAPFDVARLVTHRFRLEEFPRALAAASSKAKTEAVKVAFDFPN